MNMEEEEFSPFSSFGSGCDLHGEDFLRECTMCGIEFCSACFPQSALCSDCAAQVEFDDDEEEPTEEEKELLLLEGFNDDEPAETEETPSPIPPQKPVAPRGKAGKKASAAPQAKAKAPPRATSKPALKAAQPKAKGKSKTKANPAPQKRKA